MDRLISMHRLGEHLSHQVELVRESLTRGEAQRLLARIDSLLATAQPMTAPDERVLQLRRAMPPVQQALRSLSETQLELDQLRKRFLAAVEAVSADGASPQLLETSRAELHACCQAFDDFAARLTTNWGDPSDLLSDSTERFASLDRSKLDRSRNRELATADDNSTRDGQTAERAAHELKRLDQLLDDLATALSGALARVANQITRLEAFGQQRPASPLQAILRPASPPPAEPLQAPPQPAPSSPAGSLPAASSAIPIAHAAHLTPTRDVFASLAFLRYQHARLVGAVERLASTPLG